MPRLTKNQEAVFFLLKELEQSTKRTHPIPPSKIKEILSAASGRSSALADSGDPTMLIDQKISLKEIKHILTFSEDLSKFSTKNLTSREKNAIKAILKLGGHI